MGPSLAKNHFLRCRDCLSLINCIAVFTLSLLMKLLPRKLELSFYEISFFWVAVYLNKSTMRYSMEHCCHVITAWISWISYSNGYIEYIGLLISNFSIWHGWLMKLNLLKNSCVICCKHQLKFILSAPANYQEI